MRTILIFIILFLFTDANAQRDLQKIFDELVEEKKYSEIIFLKDKYGEKDLSAKILYQIASAYFILEDYPNSISYINKYLNLEKEKSLPYYFLGIIYFEQGNYDSAFIFLDKAIEISDKAIEITDEKNFYKSEKAFLLFKLDIFDEAEIILNEIYNTNDTLDAKAYYILFRINLEQDNDEKAYQYLSEGLVKSNKDDDNYHVLLSSMGIKEYYNKNPSRSNKYLVQAYELDPESNSYLPEIIQNFFKLEDYTSAEKYINILNEKFRKGELSDWEKSFFIFDRFDWNGGELIAYENFAEPDPDIDISFHKHEFYFYDEKDSILFTIQTELFNTFGLSKDIIYVLGKSRKDNDVHYHETYGTLMFKLPMDYRKLKESVMKILNMQEQPTSSSISK
jgi:tetratricopeptide (TPR) repeat protein